MLDGKTKSISYKSLDTLCEAFGCGVGDLIVKVKE